MTKPSGERANSRVAVLARSVYPLHRFGGLERHVFDLVRNLLDRGLEVVLITPPRSRTRPPDPEADGVFRNPRLTIIAVPYRTFPLAGRAGTTVLDRSTAYPVFGWRAGRAALRLSRAGQVDIVHGLGASALGYAVGRRRDSRPLAPFVFNPQGLEEFGATDPARARFKRLGYAPLRRAVRACARAADRVLATDRSLVPAVLGHLGVSERIVRVVPNAVEVSDCDRPETRRRAIDLRSRLGLGPEDVLLLSVGRLEANKGFEVLVRALGAMAAKGTLPRAAWRWVLVGDGPVRERLVHEIRAHQLGAHAHLAGRADPSELHGWYEAATLFVHPTLYEGSSLVTLEAMAHRRAVVATRAGGLPDKVKPGINGWLVQPGDPGALADAIREALSDRDRLLSMGAAGRGIVEAEFSWRIATDRLLDVYGEVLS